jgi:biotin transport system substrate-specific component
MNVVNTLVFGSKYVRGLQTAMTVLLCSLLVALCSKISIPLFFTPVPLTIQNSLILFLAILLGSKKGLSSVFCLLAQTAMGYSVLSSGAFGLAAFVGPTGGYLMGYLAAAFFTGCLAERASQKSASQAFLFMAAGNLLIYLLGAGYLATFVGLKPAFWLGIVPFFLGDLFKLLIAAKALQWLGWNK